MSIIQIQESQEVMAQRVASAINRASAHISAVRADARQSSEPDRVSRALIRSWANSQANAVRTDASDVGLSAEQLTTLPGQTNQLMDSVARGLGFRADGNDLSTPLGRADASNFFPGEGIARSSEIVTPLMRDRKLMETLPRRLDVPAGAQGYTTRYGGYEGKAAIYTQGSTDIPLAHSSVGETLATLTTIWIGTSTPSLSILAGQRSPNEAQMDAMAADDAIKEVIETSLVTGIPGTFTGIRQIPGSLHNSTVNYSTETNMDTIWADLIAMVQSVPIANSDVGDGPTVLLIGTRWLRALMRRSNFNAGGSATGGEFFASLIGKDAGVRAAFAASGITQIVGVPSLNGQAPYGADPAYDSAVMYRPDPMGLRYVMALPTSPVGVVNPNGMENITIWAAQIGSIEAPRAYSVGRAYARVA